MVTVTWWVVPRYIPTNWDEAADRVAEILESAFMLDPSVTTVITINDRFAAGAVAAADR